MTASYDTPDDVVREISKRYASSDITVEALADQLSEEGVPRVRFQHGRWAFDSAK
ncbi:hypothetical protein GCM10010218_20200 [Streptomyces mashuensis]|uniref:Uncharacterized protein n=1 Tax=Streptomyces mashuensis TaxID=33904 RepID=A0A919B0Y4_9ACTN|nr:hypothetical protein [Streptomyces mashuensis]GHF38904.1 hypothetical protein GCM10010218_20200 [Streptomyces mashuensis]